MKSEVAGHVTTEALIEIAQHLVARLQDAGVTHVRDVSVVFHPTDAKGLDIEVGTLAGPVDTLPLDCTHLTLSMPVHKISVLRQAPGRRPRAARPRRSPDH
jgi:hypothetical protein